jgi:hypothetical protein
MSARRRLWWVAGGTAWAALLIGLGGYATGDDPPTIRDQRPVAEALPVVHRVAGQVLAAAGPGRVAEFRPLRADGCRITPSRDGRRLTRDILVHTDPSAAPGVLDAVAAALPPAWDASVWHHRDGTDHQLSADAGEFVGVEGAVEQDGALVRLQITTGCRPLDGATVPGASPAEPGADLDRVVQAVGAVPAATTADTLPCPSGPPARSVTVDAAPAPADLGTGLRVLAPAVVRAEPTVYAWRTGPSSIVVTAADGRIRASATTGCA